MSPESWTHAQRSFRRLKFERSRISNLEPRAFRSTRIFKRSTRFSKISNPAHFEGTQLGTPDELDLLISGAPGTNSTTRDPRRARFHSFPVRQALISNSGPPGTPRQAQFSVLGISVPFRSPTAFDAFNLGPPWYRHPPCS